MALDRRIALLLAAVCAAAVMSLPATPAFAAGQDKGATFEQFVCFRSAGEKIRLGTGKVVTTPSGKVNAVCTGKRSF